MTERSRFLIDHLDTPIGQLALVVDGEGRLCAVGFTAGHSRMDRQLRGYESPRGDLAAAANPGGLTRAFRAYFDGELSAIDDLPVQMNGTPFQTSVWRALRQIPCGETRSYGELARSIRNPAAVRAVGLANGSNPIALVVPCHRVIGADGSLTGYGAGVERKRWLLSHERAGRYARAHDTAVGCA